ncbi:hypothetical protein [Breoghania sp. JC706]|uniref:hypothetical protein n=1 Tax=Breoghania sp. JC706 TaxID=3117732 RepID=UPI0030086542
MARVANRAALRCPSGIARRADINAAAANWIPNPAGRAPALESAPGAILCEGLFHGSLDASIVKKTCVCGKFSCLVEKDRRRGIRAIPKIEGVAAPDYNITTNYRVQTSSK